MYCSLICWCFIGVLQQDDVRRLILQWAGSTRSNTNGCFQPPPMLPPTSLPREEVVAFVGHLDKDGDGHIDIAEFCDFIIQGMSLEIADRDLYSEQGSLHQKLMSIITNVERRLVAMTLKGESLVIATIKEEKSKPQEEKIEVTPPSSKPTKTKEESNSPSSLNSDEQKLKEDNSDFIVTEAHYDVALRSLFRNYDNKMGAFHAEALGLLMTDFAGDDSSLHAEGEELNVFVQAMDSDGDGTISENELVSFFLSGYYLTPKKREKFSKRSGMHFKIMRVISITELAIQKRVRAVHRLFLKYDSRGIDELNTANIGAMIRGTINVEVTDEELNLFVTALDSDGDGSILFDELLHFFLKGLAQSEEKRKGFAARSPFHAKLDMFMGWILEQEWKAEEEVQL